VLNADDPLVLGLAARGPARVMTFGFGEADVTARSIQARPGAGSTFALRVRGDEVPVTLAVPGRHMIQSALAAGAVGAVLGVPVDAIARGLGRAQSVAQRLEVQRIGGMLVINDVYNSSPRSMAAALDVMDELPDGRGSRSSETCASSARCRSAPIGRWAARWRGGAWTC